MSYIDPQSLDEAGLGNSVALANSMSPYIPDNVGGIFEGIYGGGLTGGMPVGGAMAGLMRGMSSQVRQGFSPEDPAASQKKPGPANQVPGPLQKTMPNTPAGLSVADIGGLPTPASQAAVIGVRTTPTGAEWPAGSVVKNRYPKLNGLMNKAQGAYYG